MIHFFLCLLVVITMLSQVDCLTFGNFNNIWSGLSGAKTTSTQNKQAIKSELLTLSKSVQRGLTETKDQRERIISLFEQLERSSPTKSPLASDKLSAVWNLEYTTSDSILGRKGFRKLGPVLQTINAKELSAENSETISVLGFAVPRKVTAKLSPISASKVAVQFKVFSVGPISFNAPDSARGELDITYLDDDLRLSRGDKGSLFVLTKYKSL